MKLVLNEFIAEQHRVAEEVEQEDEAPRGQRLVEISRPRLAGAEAAPSLDVELARTPPPSGKCRSDENWTAHRPWPLSHRNRRLDGRMVLVAHEREVVVAEVEDSTRRSR